MMTILTSFLGYLSRVPSAVVRGWDRFFFTPSDPIMLCMIRIAVGSILLYIHVASAVAVLDFIGPGAWVDPETYTELHDLPSHPKYQLKEKEPLQSDLDFQAVRQRMLTPYGFSIWFLVTDPFWVQVTYYAGIVCIGLFTLGFATRITGIISWAFHLSYVHRAMMIWFGMDAMLSFMLLYLCISPCGSMFSLDRWIVRKWYGDKLPPLRPMWSATLGLRCMQIHMCIVYFIAGVAKLEGKTWWNGSATWLTMNSPLFNEGVDVSWMTDPRIGEWFWHYFCFLTTYATLVFEITFPFLIWNRYLRPWLIFGSFMLHGGIAIFMGLGGFGAVMFSGCMSFMPANGMRWFLHSLFGNCIPDSISSTDERPGS